MIYRPINYYEPLFRPPGEAYSAILQATIGCSWNRCAFCEMYVTKVFRVRKSEDISADIDKLASIYKGVRKIFIADGNAFVLSSSKLIPILKEINQRFGRVQRISSYALPKDILSKSDDDLREMYGLGLKLLYIGIETGDDALLHLLNKGETYASTLEGISKAHQAGIDTSVMIITGIGGQKYSHQHAVNSARIVNQLNPKFLSTLTLSLPFGIEHYKSRFGGDYKQQSLKDLLIETRTFIERLEVQNTIFRSDHISNNLALKGTLPKDKDVFIAKVNSAMNSL